MKSNDLIKGTLIGICLGGVLGLFLAPKSGKEIQEDILAGYNKMNAQSHQFADNFKEYANSFIDYLQGVDHSHEPKKFIYGGLAGLVLGVLAGLILAPQSGNKLRERLLDEYDHIYDNAKDVMKSFRKGKHNFEDKLEDWKDIFVTILDKVSQPKLKNFNGEHVNKILDWADLGLRLYNTVQNRR